jgi:MFS family permease
LALPLALAPPSIPLAVAVVTLMSLAGPLRYGPLGALIADVIPEERREAAFAANRIAYNVAALAGPLLGAALVAVDWRALHAGVALVFSLSLPAALRLPRTVGRRGLTRRAFALGQFASRGFLVVFGSSLAATVTYNSFETLFPVSLTQSHGLAPSQWGVLFVINPIVVMLMQLRVTRWTSGLGQATKLAIALPVMGFAFLPLLVDANAAVLVLIMLVFVAGEMLWAPTAETLVARLAPSDGRGAYMSTLGIAGGVGAALTPALGLHVRAAAGDEAMWLVVATVSAVAGTLYVLAARTSRTDLPEPVPA